MGSGQDLIMNFENSNLGAKGFELSEVVVLAIDCQATHSNPAKGNLIEIGWVSTRASAPFIEEAVNQNAETYLIRIKDFSKIPKQFLRITGINREEFQKARHKKFVWQRLCGSAQKTAVKNGGIPLAAIHYSRYEESYLRQIHKEFCSGQEFPFFIVCTHEIFRRLYPRHPRKSLRAVAGYLGHPLPDARRSLYHVTATAYIWNQIVRLLEEKEGITRLNDLVEWMDNSFPRATSRKLAREYPMEKKVRQDLCDRPGIYRMYRSSGDLLYIGKAKSLKRRVNSYFHPKIRHSEHILEMLSQATSLSTTITRTALEAAIRESDEINGCSPPYNRALRPLDRKVLFYTKKLKSAQTQPDSRHRIGPIPSNIRLDSLALLTDVLNNTDTPTNSLLVKKILLTPPEHIPDTECFRSGIATFKQEISDLLQPPLELSALMSMGANFWQKILDERESAATSEIEEKQDEESIDNSEPAADLREEPDSIIWTPERVVKAIKRIIRIGAFSIRRARWFCRLYESTLFWSKADRKARGKNLLLIQNGFTIFKEELSPLSRDRIIPPGHRKSLFERQKHFDIATYDRMRVLTTEMRRILREGRDMELCFHPKNILDSEQLQKMLKWV